MKPSIAFAALLVLMLLSSGGKATAAKEVAVDGSAAETVEGFCDLDVVDCPFETVEYKIRKAAKEAGVDEETAVRIATCESQLNTLATNPRSSAKGLYQFLDGTWAWVGAEGHQFDVDESIKQFMKWYQRHPEWWLCK